MKLGLGLGLGAQTPSPQGVTAQEPLQTAIKERTHIIATINGGRIVLQPYGLFRGPGGTILEAVVVFAENGDVRSWRPGRFDIAILQAVDRTIIPFLPNALYRVGPRKMKRALAVIEPVENIEDFLEAHSG